MTKKEMRLLILLGISIILANLVLRLILRPLPENIGYLIKNAWPYVSILFPRTETPWIKDQID